ncbi:MAG: M6 family metalloprotease domain-containing protein [Longimicrobiales bacterium]
MLALVIAPALGRWDLAAQNPLPFPAASGEVTPPTSIAGLADARPASALEFSRAWLLKMESVRRKRAELAAAGRLDGMTPAAAALAGAALTGTLRVPVLAVRYSDVKEPFPVEKLTERLFGAPRGDTMTYSAYWREVSGGLLEATGALTSWIPLSKPAAHYLPREKFGWGQFGRMNELRAEALRMADQMFDFTQFDNDGPDGVPDTDDDDGFVDFVAFVYALPCTGETRAGAIWPHRAAMTPFETGDRNHRGQPVRIADYVILPAVDPQSCGPMHIGVLAHETGHALGLPDLYDYDGTSQGIGAWGLMGTGSHNARHSPSHLSAWEKEQLGWVSVKWLRASSSVSIEPVERDPVVYRYDLPRRSGDYVLLENRQRLGSDTFLPGHGLLAWRIDSERGELGAWNSDERRPAVALVDADGRADLRNGARADVSDPFPGGMAQRTFAMADVPTLRLTNITENAQTITADVAVGREAPALTPETDAIRLTAFAGDSTVSYSVRVHSNGAVGAWTAVTDADWLGLAPDGDALRVHANTRKLVPGRHTEVVDLQSESGSVAGRLTVDIYIAEPGRPEVMATDLPWSWGLAAHGPQIFQASYGWDPLGLRPRPRVLHLRDGELHPATYGRVPADALFSPVPLPDGSGVYVIARARDENFIYRIDANGNATVVAARIGTSPAYGAALLPGGDLLVAEWNGTIWRVNAEGQHRQHARLKANLYQIATDARGTVYAATYAGHVIRLHRDGTVQTLTTGFQKGRLVAVAASPDGQVYAAERGENGRIIGFDSKGSRRLVFQSPNARFYGLSVEQEFLYALDLQEGRLLRLPLNQRTRQTDDND